MSLRAAFAVHPLAPWQLRLLGVRHRDRALLAGRPVEAVRRVATLRVPTRAGEVLVDLIGVPAPPEVLVAEQRRALQWQIRAAEVARARGASVLGLGSALAVVAGRGAALAGAVDLPITTGHAATAWACAALTRQAAGDEPLGVLGARGTVGEAVARDLARTHRVLVDVSGRAARRLAGAGVETTSRGDLLRTCRVVVGAETTGPSLAPGDLQPGTVLVDLSNPPTLHPGPRPAGVVVLAGETLAWPARPHGRVWGNLWRLVAGYEAGSAYACLAEPLAAAALGRAPWSGGRHLDLHAVHEVGEALTHLGFTPRLLARR